MQPAFLGLSTGRAGSRYLTQQLQTARIPTLHEQNIAPGPWNGHGGAVGEVSAHLVTRVQEWPDARVWHFSRHPQPFVTSLLRFGFWTRMHAPAIHPYLERTGDDLVDSYGYWLEWNRRILEIPAPRRITFRIEDISPRLLQRLADSIGFACDTTRITPRWNEKQDFAPIPAAMAEEIEIMMDRLGYASA